MKKGGGNSKGKKGMKHEERVTNGGKGKSEEIKQDRKEGEEARRDGGETKTGG